MTSHERADRTRPSRSASCRQSAEQLEARVAEAIVDCHNEDEQVTGLFTMIEDNLVRPFRTVVVGVGVAVR